MSKRKRQDDAEPDPQKTEARALRITVLKLKTQISHSNTSLLSALKLARGFERQKLGRRQKNANDDPPTLLRLREEVIVLKHLDLEQTAEKYLFKQLVKAKRIKEHPAFINAYGSDPAPEPVKSGAEANVIGRLFNSAPVKRVVPDIVKSIYGLLRIPQPASGDSRRAASVMKEVSDAKADSRDVDGQGGFSHDNSEPPNQPSDLGLGDDQFLENYAKGRLASSEAESDGEASDAQSLVRFDAQRRGNKSDRSLTKEDISMSPSPNEEIGLDGQPPVNAKLVQRVNKTAFLPSLSMGGYYSGSESEEDDGYQYHGPAQPQVRKNRRGQRARQQIAEWKYGKNAKHLEKQKDTVGREAGWDPKRGAVAQGNPSRERFRKGKPGQKLSSEHPVGNSGRPSKSKSDSRDDQGSLHPSWEAAKRKKMQDQTQAAFQGKRITFD